MSDTIDILSRNLFQHLKLFALIIFGSLGFSPVLMFLFAGIGDYSQILGRINNLILGFGIFFMGLYVFWFGFKYREFYRKDPKAVLDILIGGSIAFVFGIFFLNSYLPTLSHGMYISIQIPLVMMMLHPLVMSLSSIILGTVLLIKNNQSSVTRLLFLSYLSFGGAWIFYTFYNASTYAVLHPYTAQDVWIGFALDVSVFYLGFYLFFLLGVVLLIHGCRRIVTPSDQRFPWWFSLSQGTALVVTIFLSFTELSHYTIDLFGDADIEPTQLLYLREHSLIFAIVYSLSLLLPLLFSVYLLSKPPPWITKERRHWINRTRMSLILLSLYPLIEVLSGLPGLPFFSNPISVVNPIPVKVLLLTGSISLIYFSYVIMLTGIDDVNKWFFDEVKCRATPELQKLDPEVNLAKVWEKIDQMQKEQPLSPKEMTNQKVREYVQTAVNYWMSLENSKLAKQG